ncbi:MAG TPA: VOC family protein [Chryseosolibacter sp.]|jgi:lactoylglutathione lyase|nr:VOC family protein [Chryseosolibacter sp.]
MNNNILGLRTTIYKVADIQAAKKWYAKVFETQPYFDEPYYVGFNIGGYELGLQLEGKAVDDKPDSVVAYWGVADVQKTVKDFLASGATAHEKPQDVGEGIIVASVKDPWKNVIGLIYNPHFKIA